MKATLLITSSLLFSALGFSQQWKQNLKESLREAARQDKKVLLYFSIAEACDACKSLEKNVWDTPEFKTFARENYILVKADFSEAVDIEDRAENLLIVEKYNKDGFFPLVVIMDSNAKVLGKTGIYKNEEPTAYIESLKSISR